MYDFYLIQIFHKIRLMEMEKICKIVSGKIEI